VVGRDRRVAAGGEALDGAQHGARRGFRDFDAVQAGLLRRAHGKGLARPDRAGVHLGFGLQHGDAPFAFAVLDRPVERRRAAVADDAGMHDQAGVPAPDRFWNRAAQIGRDDQIGAEERDGLLGDRVGDVEFDADPVAACRQFAEQALRQAVEGVGQKQDAHPAISPHSTHSTPCRQDFLRRTTTAQAHRRKGFRTAATQNA